MKLVRFGEKGSEKPGVLVDGKRRDCSSLFGDWDAQFFNSGGPGKLKTMIEEKGGNLPPVPESERWASCVPRSGMIMCVGLNYSDHARESGMDLPEEPIIFMKATNTLHGPFDEVEIPRQSRKTDWEVELAVVIGKDSLYLENEEEAQEAIAGFCIMNDLSEREFQLERGGQWVKGKSCPGFSPLGPYLVTRDEIKNVLDLKMQLSVNGELMQRGNTGNMAFKPDFLVYYISRFMKLEAGDVIATGTPPGVGLGQSPQRFLAPGDVVELGIEQLGSQKQKFVQGVSS
jgi:2-keto-4-pentenoate hydratase/2-oxohepta-3-ene-1,7-dioic acid hydratase in catechol pathway